MEWSPARGPHSRVWSSLGCTQTSRSDWARRAGRSVKERAARRYRAALLPAVRPPYALGRSAVRVDGSYRMLPEPRLRMLSKLPLATATLRSPDWAVLPYPTWAKLKLAWWEWAQQQRVSRLGSSSACSSSSSSIVTASAVDIEPPSKKSAAA